MATRQAWAGWAVVVAAAMLLGAPGCGAKREPSGSQAASPKELTLDLGGGVTLALTLIQAGKFVMGTPPGEANRDNDENQHEVSISKPFYMGVTEVTQAQYQAVMGTNPSYFKGATNPVEMVSWLDATEFCKKLSEKTRQAVRLPTEAEWEYACRAGTNTRFSFGDSDADVGDYAWYYGNSGDTTHPVGQKKPNAWGLFDMHGNVWEWCADLHGEYPKGPVTDPYGSATGDKGYLVLRGGSWNRANAGAFRCASRSSNGPSARDFSIGFRVVVPVSAPGL